MRAMVSLRNLLLLSSLAAVAITCAGCPANNSVLTGSWALDVASNPNPSLTHVVVTFNTVGVLTSFTYTFNGTTATVSTPDLTAITTVDGSTVTIHLNFSGPSQATFTGTLNADNTVITGTLQYSLVIGNTTIAAPNGTAATLTKI